MNPHVTVIGCDGRPPGPDAATALAAARTVIGAARHQHLVPAGAEFIELRHLAAALDTIATRPGNIAVLASGDPGFFGIVRALRARGVTPAVIPAVSSVSLAFARIGLDWDDALILSAHGRDVRKPLAAALAHPKAAILTEPGAAHDLGKQLLAAGKAVYVAERLGTPHETVRLLSDEDEAEEPLADPNILISLDEQPPGEPRWLAGHQGAPDGWALPEDAFAHRDSMITKAEVRALVLARLGPAPGRTIWDVGAGSGSVAVECARFGARVIAIESDPVQCARIRENAERHHVRPHIVQGHAPEALKDLPPPDAVFAGGGDHAVLETAIQQAAPARVVVTLATIQRVGETTGLLTHLGYQAEGVQLQASRLAALPNTQPLRGVPGGSPPRGQHRLAAQNPVFVLWGQR